ncbi:TadE family protein [Nocardioides zeicaulis]|uniref:TadE family protein n=1 Tax=Nocardioides zeicaulis TaxID=1776857 RepID=A0ABV6E3L2_9ACTN
MRFFIRRRDDRGAVAVEFALTVPILLTFLLGTVELGLYMKDYISMSSSVRAGARSASAAADAGPGTCEASASPPPCSPASVPAFAQAAADTMQTAGMAMNSQDIQWVMIYKANANGYPGSATSIPSSCGGVANCVVYVWDPGVVTANGTGRFRYASGSWASASVNACLNETDAVGVALRANHNWMTGLVSGLMGGNKVMTERTVMKFEPLEQDRCKPGTPNAHN